ncbi:alpha/beta hydrolase [Variovorax sp. GB1P17]|uniref:alpha/beta hydrolase n=1 Tax=Variovorax sp. GB1P17 TaxID=3443740 RepID=UPI003F4585E0
MKTSKTIAVVALSMLAVAGVHAEGYETVQPLKAATSRTEVASKAAAAARDGNVYGDVVEAPAVSRPGLRDRASVRAEAVATAHAPNQNLDRRAFANSEVPPQFRTARP